MTVNDFSHLLNRIKGLSPEQARQLREQLDRHSAMLTKAPSPTPGTAPNRSSPTVAKQKMTEAEFDQHLLRIGLMSQLPDTAADYDDPDDVPVLIKGEPFSETIIRERR
jgi:hypothetical protein